MKTKENSKIIFGLIIQGLTSPTPVFPFKINNLAILSKKGGCSGLLPFPVSSPIYNNKIKKNLFINIYRDPYKTPNQGTRTAPPCFRGLPQIIDSKGKFSLLSPKCLILKAKSVLTISFIIQALRLSHRSYLAMADFKFHNTLILNNLKNEL